MNSSNGSRNIKEQKKSAVKRKEPLDNFRKPVDPTSSIIEYNSKQIDEKFLPNEKTHITSSTIANNTKKSFLVNKIGQTDKIKEPITNDKALDPIKEVVFDPCSLNSKPIVPEMDASPSKKDSEDPSLPLAKRIKLEVIDVSALPLGTIININARGVIGSKRNESDGYTYFGSAIPNVNLI